MDTLKPLKGNAIVAQSGGCTAVINQSLAGIAAQCRLSRSVPRLFGSRHGIEGILYNELVDLSAKPATLIKKIADTPSASLGSSRYKLAPEDGARITSALRHLNVRYLFLIGGNDTANTSLAIARAAAKSGYELRVIHIPKTIDNDLLGTDHCPGYGSVARFVAMATQEAALDTRAMQRVDPVKIIEVMGRNAGWIVAASALLKKNPEDAPHILLVPEVPFEEVAFIKRVEATLQTVGYCIVVLSETIRDHSGKRIGEKRAGITSDPFGHRYVEGTSERLATIVEKNLRVRARFDKPGTIQRMSMAYISKVDQKEAFEAGQQAVKWALKGFSRVMVGFKRKTGKIYGINYEPIPLEKIPNKERLLPEEFFNTKKLMVTPLFKDYAFPLIGKNLPIFPVL